MAASTTQVALHEAKAGTLDNTMRCEAYTDADDECNYVAIQQWTVTSKCLFEM